jgi:hypothetical protein
LVSGSGALLPHRLSTASLACLLPSSAPKPGGCRCARWRAS